MISLSLSSPGCCAGYRPGSGLTQTEQHRHADENLKVGGLHAEVIIPAKILLSANLNGIKCTHGLDIYINMGLNRSE